MQEGQQSSKHDWWRGLLAKGVEQDWWPRQWVTAIDRCLDEDAERELNQLDSHGTTFLHEAAKLANDKFSAVHAISGLLQCGADVNLTDSHGKTALRYYETGDDVSFLDLQMHFSLLRYQDLHICEQNRQWYSEQYEIFAGVTDDYNAFGTYADRLENMERDEIAALRDTRVNEQMTLAQALNEASDGQLVWQLDDLRAVVKSAHFNNTFYDFRGLIMQRYRKARLARIVRRKKLKPLARQAIKVLFELPDVCNEIILDYLSYNDFVMLLQAFNSSDVLKYLIASSAATSIRFWKALMDYFCENLGVVMKEEVV